MGTKCDPKAESTNVFVVDLPPETRSDLELAVSGDSLAVASFDCKSLKILRQCKASGTYSFKGTSAKERVLSLESADEIKATLPLGGAGIAAAFSAEASTGTKFDLGMILAGQMVGSSSSFGAAELTGSCSGATHVITAAKVGAFAMGTSSNAEMRTAAEIFGAGASAGSKSSKLARARDGSIKACDEAAVGAEKAPKNCDAVIALEVTKLAGELGATDDDGLTDLLLGLSYSDFMCKDAAECEASCNKGKGRGCTSLGLSLIDGNGMEKNLPRGRQLVRKGCELGDMKGCAAFAEVITVDGRLDEALQYAEKSCNSGDGWGCMAAVTIWSRKSDKEQADKFKLKACMHNYPNACNSDKN